MRRRTRSSAAPLRKTKTSNSATFIHCPTPQKRRGSLQNDRRPSSSGQSGAAKPSTSSQSSRSLGSKPSSSLPPKGKKGIEMRSDLVVNVPFIGYAKLWTLLHPGEKHELMEEDDDDHVPIEVEEMDVGVGGSSEEIGNDKVEGVVEEHLSPMEEEKTSLGQGQTEVEKANNQVLLEETIQEPEPTPIISYQGEEIPDKRTDPLLTLKTPKVIIHRLTPSQIEKYCPMEVEEEQREEEDVVIIMEKIDEKNKSKKKIMRKYICNFCGEKASSFTSLEIHIRSHTGEKPFACPICQKKFASGLLLRNHHKSIHVRPIQTCGICQSEFRTGTELRFHIRQKHKPPKVKKVVDPTPVPAPVPLPNSTTLKFDCPHCQRSFPLRRGLSVHISLKHKETVQEKHLEMGEIPVTENESFACHHCSQTLPTLELLQIHVRDHAIANALDKMPSLPYQCPQCSKGFFTRGALYGHSRECAHTSSIILKFPAKPAGQSEVPNEGETGFPRIDSIVGSLPKVPVKPTPSSEGTSSSQSGTTVQSVPALNFRCPHCPLQFFTEEFLSVHQRVHKKDMPFTCLHCPQTFKYSSSLLLHQRIHVKTVTFACLECPAQFLSENLLTAHQLSHQQPSRPPQQQQRQQREWWKCGFCPKVFASKNRVKQHEALSHPPSAPVDQPNSSTTTDNSGTTTTKFVCKFCSKPYVHASALEVHQRLHTGERPFACHICSHRFRGRRNLRHHVEKRHQGGNTDTTGQGEGETGEVVQGMSGGNENNLVLLPSAGNLKFDMEEEEEMDIRDDVNVLGGGVLIDDVIPNLPMAILPSDVISDLEEMIVGL